MRHNILLLGCVPARGDAGELFRVYRRHPQGDGPHLRSYGKYTFWSLMNRSNQNKDHLSIGNKLLTNEKTDKQF